VRRKLQIRRLIINHALLIGLLITAFVGLLPASDGFNWISLNVAIPGLSWGLKTLPVQLTLLCVVIGRFRNRAELLPHQLFKMPLFYAMVAYALLAVISILFAANKGAAMSDLNFRFWLAWVPIYIFACGPRKPQDALSAIYLMMGVAAIVALLTLWFGITHHFRVPFYANGLGVRINHNPIGDVCAILAICSFGLVLTRQKRSWRWWSAGGLALGALGTISTWSRGATFGLLAALATVVASSQVKTWQKIVVLTVMPIALLIAFKLAPEETQEYNLRTENSTISGRAHIYSMEWDYLSSNIFRAAGIGNSVAAGTQEVVDTFGNVIMQDWIQLSPAGVLLLVLSAILIIVLGVSNAKRLPQNSRLASINYAALGIAVLFMVHGLVDEFWTRIYNKSTMFSAVGLMLFVKFSLDKLAAENEAKQLAVMADNND
jgi:hypothetical protein